MRTGVPLLNPITRWYCPACHATDVTTRADFHQQFHTCPKLGFLSVPLVREGQKAKVEAREIEGYVGSEVVRYDADGRPIMSVVTIRDEGQDCTVYAPMARASFNELLEETP